jgi:hypothetical protein
MANPEGEAESEAVRLDFDRRLSGRPADERDELASPYVEHGLLRGTRSASLRQAKDALEAPAGPWARPESF